MAATKTPPLFTREYDTAASLSLPNDSSYLFSVTAEPRSEMAEGFRSRCAGVTFVRIGEEQVGSFTTDMPGFERVATRQRAPLQAFVNALPKPVHIDMTGLGHSTWAPLVRICAEAGIPFRVVYLEPASYNASAHPGIGTIYDLSEEIEGIKPIPLFAKLVGRRRNDATFVPLLGFEGARFKHMLNEVDPSKDKVHPIVGAPGFAPHYPLDAIALNADGLEQDKASIRNLRFAKSNCPFSLYHELADIGVRHPDDLLRIGLIGTKPHALGAILFSIRNDERTEVVYDHARRKAGRSVGAAKCLVYSVSDFLAP